MFLRCFYFFAKSEPHVFNDLFFNKRKVCNHLKKNIKCSRGDYVNLYILLLSVIMVTLDEKSNLKSMGSFGLRKKKPKKLYIRRHRHRHRPLPFRSLSNCSAPLVTNRRFVAGETKDAHYTKKKTFS